MKTRNTIEKHCAEPMYDDYMLELIERQETEELIKALADYCKNLEEQVVDLRCRVNRLTPAGSTLHFPEPHSDLYEVFYHYAAYTKFQHVLKNLD